MHRTTNNFFSPPPQTQQRPTTTVPSQQRFTNQRSPQPKLSIEQQEKLQSEPPLYKSLDKILQNSKAYKTESNFQYVNKRGRVNNATNGSEGANNNNNNYNSNGSQKYPYSQQQQLPPVSSGQSPFRSPRKQSKNQDFLFPQQQQNASPGNRSSYNNLNNNQNNISPSLQNNANHSPLRQSRLGAGSQQQQSIGNNNAATTSSSSNSGQQTNMSLQMIGQGAKLSSVIYILGPLSGELLFFIDNHSRLEQQTNEYIAKMRATEFSQLQKQRSQKLMNLYQKFFIDTVLAQEKEKEGMKEIGMIMKKELITMLDDYERYIETVEENFKKLNLFQEKEIILLTDFHEGMKMLSECYNYQFLELGSFGKTRPEQTVYIKSIHQFKTQLKSEPKNQKAFKIFEDIEVLLKSQFEKIHNSVLKVDQLTTQNNELMKLCEQLQKEKHEIEFSRLKGLKEGQALKTDPLADTNQKYGIVRLSQQSGGGTTGAGGPGEEQQKNVFYKDDFLSTHITQLKIDNKRLNEQLQRTLKQLQQLQSQSQQQQQLQQQQQQNSPMANGNGNNGNGNGNGTFVVNAMQGQLQQQQQQQQQQQRYNNNVNGNYVGLKKYLMVDQEVQCVYMVESNAVSRRDYSILNIMQNPHPYIKSANLQTREWCLMVVDLILTDKVLSEIFDSADQRPRTPLNKFVVEWFLRRFGNKDVAEILLKDFLISLKKYGRQTERFRLFCEFCSLDESLLTDGEFQGGGGGQQMQQGQGQSGGNPNNPNNPNNSNPNNPNNPNSQQSNIVVESTSTISSIGINRAKLRRIYLRTDDAMHIFYKIAHMVRQLGSNFFGAQTYLPLFPNIFTRGLDLVAADSAAKLWEALAEDENLHKVDPQSIEGQFKKTFALDLAQRQAGNDVLGVYTAPLKDDEEAALRFDTYARQVLESVVDQRVFELEQLYTAMKLKSNPKYECMMQFDDFAKICLKSFPKKSQRWIEIAYREFCDGVLTEKTPLNIAILKIIPLMSDDDCVKENFLKIRSLLFGGGVGTNNNNINTSINNNNISSNFISGESSSGAQQHQQQSISGQSKFQANSSNNKQKSISQNRGGNLGKTASTKGNSMIKGNSKAGMDFQQEQQQNQQQTERDRMMSLQDHVTSLGLLEESYKIMQPLIINLEKRNEGLIMAHDKFKEDMMILPQNICKMQRYDEFSEYEKKDLLTLLDNAWNKFRKMLVYIAKTN